MSFSVGSSLSGLSLSCAGFCGLRPVVVCCLAVACVWWVGTAPSLAACACVARRSSLRCSLLWCCFFFFFLFFFFWGEGRKEKKNLSPMPQPWGSHIGGPCKRSGSNPLFFPVTRANHRFFCRLSPCTKDPSTVRIIVNQLILHQIR